MISCDLDDTSSRLYLGLVLGLVVFCNKMLQQLEDMSYVKPSEVVRQTYESISAPVVEAWDEEEIFWVFGKKFSLPQQRDEFLKCLKSKIWCTYRKGFCAIGGTGPTSDSGWGCMLRSGQMMLAEALTRLNLGNDWTYDEGKVRCKEGGDSSAYWKLLVQICDKRSSRYSIQQIAQMGVGEGKEVGDWFGPNTISQVLKKLSHFDEHNNLHIHVVMQNTVVIDEIEKLCTLTREDGEGECCSASSSKTSTNSSTTTSWKPLLLLIPLRLGLDELNPLYLEHLKTCMQYPGSVGFIGGKPNSAFYFLGYSDDSLVFLDPHTTQSVAKFPDANSIYFDDSTYHCESPRRMSFNKLDPSLALGFFFPTHQSFTLFCQQVQSYKPTAGCERIISAVPTMPFNVHYEIRSRDKTKKKQKTKQQQQHAEREKAEDTTNLFLELSSDDNCDSDESYEILEF